MKLRAAADADSAALPASGRWPDGAIVGLACSMRTFAGPASLAARGRILSPWRYVPAPWDYGFLLAALGELLIDKTALATNRTDAPALGARIVSGGLTGREVAGLPGLLAGAISAGGGTFATYRARKLIVDGTGLPDRVVAVGEDLLAYSLAAFATRRLAA